MQIELDQNDTNDITKVAELVIKLAQIDADYVNNAADEIFRYQPFYLTVLIGYRFNLSTEELEEIMKSYFLIWEYFKSNPNIKRKKVTEDQYNKIEDRHIEMLKYSEEEIDVNARDILYVQDIQNVKSKALLSAIFGDFNSKPVLLKMDIQTKFSIIIGIKCFIECFETI